MRAAAMTRATIMAVALVALTTTLVGSFAAAQSPPRVFRIGFLRPGPPPTFVIEALRQSLREHGYIEGQNLSIEFRGAEGSLDDLVKSARELVQLKVDVIVASAGQAALAAKAATTTVPIVFVAVFDPVEAGLVASLSRPGGNITGLSNTAADLAGKRLELLRDVVPNLVHVGVVWDAGNPINVIQLKGARTMAARMGIALRELPVRGPKDFESAVKAARGVNGLLYLESPLFYTHRGQLADLALKNRLPAIYSPREIIDAGGLISYGPDQADLYRRSAGYVDRIFKGARPGEMPVEQPTTFLLSVNVKTARALGLTIPAAVLLRADYVIQ